MDDYTAKAKLIKKFGSHRRCATYCNIKAPRFSLLWNGHEKPNAKEAQQIRAALGSSIIALMRDRYRANRETQYSQKNVA